jgi:hypothetical protein
MAAESCLAEIQKAAGRTLSDDEIDDLLTELQRRQARAKADARFATADEAVLAAADDFAKEMAEAAVIERRGAALNLMRRMEALDFVRSQFTADPALGLESLLVGVNRARPGSRFSAAAQQKQLANHYMGGFMADVEREGLWKVFVSGALDRDIARALWAMDDAGRFAGPKEAETLAKIVRKWQEVARVDANRAGAWIKRLPGYIVRQSHDVYRIRGAGFEKWRDDILPALDVARTFEAGGDLEKALRAVYDGLSSGVHLKSTGGPSGFKGPRNIAKKASAERVLHFRDADAWSDYNAKYGTGNFREALLHGFDMSAQNTGLMRVFGPNPESNFNQMADELTRGLADAKQKQRFSEASGPRGWLRNRLETIDGTARIPVNALGARVGAVTRSVENMAKLGGATISSFSDIPLYAFEMRYQGRSVLSSMAEAIGGLAKGRNRHEMAEIDGMIGVTFDSLRGEATARFSAHDDLPGRMARAQQTFFKWNVLSWWTDAIRATGQRAMSHRLALNKALAWDGLDPDLVRTLSLYGIDAGKWDLIRAGTTKFADGREYLVPAAAQDASDAALTTYLSAKGLKATKARLRDLRDEIEGQVRTYLVDRAGFAVLEPDARTRATMLRGTRPGSVEGELIRFIMQFKSFSVATIQKPLGRELYGRGFVGATEGNLLRRTGSNLKTLLTNGNGELAGLAQLMVWTTIFGYGSMVAKDILKGRTPRDPLDPKTWAAAFVQGGGAGIYGDFLLGETSRFGGGLLQTAAGPTLGTIDDLYDIKVRLQNGDDAAAAALRLAIGNTPFANLFYTRMALDYLLLWRLQESINPGYLRRMEKRIEDENNQTFLVRPSQMVN